MRRSHSPAGQHRGISQLLLVAITDIAACSFSVVGIDRPVAEFIDANIKSEWLYTARTLAALSTLPYAPIHPAQHYTMTAAAFFRGSLGPEWLRKEHSVSASERETLR
jgi:hypothetical protein